MEKRIGFVGCYSHDVILMLAKVLGSIKKTVLIRDRNEKHTLQVSIPYPESISTVQAVAEYDGFFFTEQKPEAGQNSFDFELVDFGMWVDANEAELCSEWILVTDMLLHHIRRLKENVFPRDIVSACIMRDAIEEICTTEPEINEFFESLPNTRVYFLPQDFRDVRNRYVCETIHKYSIHNASPEMKDMIYRIVATFCPEYSEKEIRRSVKQMERRSYR